MSKEDIIPEKDTVTLTLDDDTEVECEIVSIFPVGEKEYIALLPIEENDAEDDEVFIYRYTESADGEPDLQNIEDDDEYEAVADAFDELLDSEEFDEIEDEEDDEDDDEEDDEKDVE